ncbi:HNH endonuclease signature motif containing protein [Rhodococcus tukisamuensis]|uniref:HNH endonuclease n=1 Tax=Rhodococcus tukisamuensis TaxID=168276 RepID=A0A1G6QIG8_9NOCA|nr:HNH endonuclease signature motif containing protein [Rhodococcus tukisamuensis]SDC91714.1 HNH endonuclease [Rhodococcus tukisamuensis]
MKLDAMLTDPTRVEAWRLDETELLAAVPDVSEAILKLEALRVRLVHEADERCLPTHVGAADTASWLADATHMTAAMAGRIVRLGCELPLHPRMAAALDGGRIELGHVQVIVNFLDRLTKLTVDEPDVGAAETDWEHPDPESGRPDDCQAYLLIAAHLENVTTLRRRARALELLLQLDGTVPPDGENPELNEFFASTTLGGRVLVKGTFDAEAGEALQTALSGLSKPHPSTDEHGHPIRDPRSAAKRRADALEQIIRGHLDAARGPQEGGERPHVTVTIDLDALKDAVAKTAPTPATGAWTKDGWDYHCDNATGPTGSTQGENCSDVRPPRHYRRVRHAAMPWAGPVSAAIAARLSCDATVTPIFVDRGGNPLDVGRTTRIISPKLRKALVARDCGCAFPGCGRPAAWTDAHHIIHWSDGGPTALANLVLLCKKHHTIIHKNHWAVAIGDDGHPWFTPPAWVDPARRPRPAHNRREIHGN